MRAVDIGRNEKGTSFVSILIAGVLLSIISLAVPKYFSGLARVNRSIDYQKVSMEIEDEIQMIVRDKVHLYAENLSSGGCGAATWEQKKTNFINSAQPQQVRDSNMKVLIPSDSVYASPISLTPTSRCGNLVLPNDASTPGNFHFCLEASDLPKPGLKGIERMIVETRVALTNVTAFGQSANILSCDQYASTSAGGGAGMAIFYSIYWEYRVGNRLESRVRKGFTYATK